MALGIKEQVFLAKYIETGGSISEAMKASSSEEAVKAHADAIATQYIDPENETERDLALTVPSKEPNAHLKALARLAPRERLFVREWLKDRNSQRAAIRAGYPTKNISTLSYMLMKRPDVLQAVRDLEHYSIDKHIATADEVLAELSSIATSDIRDLFDPDTNTIKNITEIPTSTARAISSFEITQNRTGKVNTEGMPAMQSSIRLRFWDKISALDKLAKFHGILSDRGIDDGLSQIDEARKAELRKALLRDLGDMAKPVPATITQDGAAA